MTFKTPGQIAYEADCAARPLYDHGAVRAPWYDLDTLIRDSWERDPTPRWSEPKNEIDLNAHRDEIIAALWEASNGLTVGWHAANRKEALHMQAPITAGQEAVLAILRKIERD